MPNPVSFTEEMKGYVTFGEQDHETGYRTGKDAATELMFHLTITVGDIDTFAMDDERTAAAVGWVNCDALGGRLAVKEGIFNLFVEPTGGATNSREMRYRLFFHDGNGHPVTLIGHKVIRDDPGFDVWSDTTTLYTAIHSGHIGIGELPEDPALATGLIMIKVLDFVRQLLTFRGATAQFGRIFMGELWDGYTNQLRAEGTQ